MVFAAPLWLIGLIPWGMVTVWLLSGRRNSERVPFLPLWQASVVNQKIRSSFHVPPIALIAVLLSVLLALISAAQPAISGSRHRVVSVVVDRGLTMSAKGTSRARFIELAELAEKKLRSVANEIEIIDPIRGDRQKTSIGHLNEFVAALPRTALDTSRILRQTIRDELLRNDNLIILLSDQSIEISDPRFQQITPENILRNVGIYEIAAKEMPSPQVMVSVRNDSAMTEAALRIVSAGQATEHRVKLPARGGQANYFFELPKFGDVIEARLDVADDLEADNVAWLVREKRPGRIEPRSAISEALQRMIDVYQRSNPPDELSPITVVFNQKSNLRADDAGVVVEAPLPQGDVRGELRVTSHPVTKLVNWTAVVADAKVAASSPEGWTPVVQVGAKTLVAIQETSSRKVWVGFDASSWPRSADYVVFWTNVFDWLANGGQAFAWHFPVVDDTWKHEGKLSADIQANAWPGIYVRSDGERKAVNAGLSRAIVPRNGANRQPPLIDNASTSRHELTAEFCLAAMACALLAAMFWKGSV